MTRILFIGAFLLWFSSSKGQFTNVTDQVGDHYGSTGTSFGSGMSFYDFDGDGWDDMSIGLGTIAPKFFKNNEGVLLPTSFNIPTSATSNVVMILWADYDNDGDQDLLITKNAGPIELWKNDGDFNFSNVASEAGLASGSYIHSGAAFADFNHDGCLDLYISTFYNQAYVNGSQYHNILYQSNCDGSFTDVTQESGVDILPSLTLQPIFIDYNKDSWEDLYLINELNLYPNHLFHNNGDGTFTEVSTETGTGIYIAAMTGTVGDYNNDLRPDIFVTNRTSIGGNHLLVDQDDGTYTNQASELGFGTNYDSYGAVWLDYNNNGWQDIFVSIPIVGSSGEDGNAFYINNAGTGFTNERDYLGFSEDFSKTYICARGDLSNDGYYDLAHSSRHLSPLQLFENNGGDNNYLSVSLQGTISNRDGIGSWIYCYSGDYQAVHFTMCGENLLGQNSDKQIFGIGQQTVVDSLIIEWNSGTREVYLQPEINTHHHLVEGASLTQLFEIAHNGNLLLCAGESTILDAGPYESYLWNTGDTTQTISVSETGSYSVEVWNEFGLSITSFPVTIEVAPENESVTVTQHVSCTGENDGSIAVSLLTGAVDSISWNVGSTAPLLDSIPAGLYHFTTFDAFGCSYKEEVVVNEPSPLLGQVETTDALCYGEASGTAMLNVLGGSSPYLPNWFGLAPEALPAGDHVAQVMDMNGCTIEIPFQIDQPDSIALAVYVEAVNGEANGSAALEITGGTPPYSVAWSTGTSDTLYVSNLSAGEYSVVVTDAENCESSLIFTVDNSTGISHPHNGDEPVLYPNPNSGQFFIANCPAPVVHIQVTDATGRTVIPRYQLHCAGNIEMDNLAPGQYTVHMSHNGAQHFLRLFIERP